MRAWHDCNPHANLISTDSRIEDSSSENRWQCNLALLTPAAAARMHVNKKMHRVYDLVALLPGTTAL